MQAGTQLLLRSVNAGLQQRRIGFADTRLTQWTVNSAFLPQAADVTAVTLPPGEVADSTAVMPFETPVNVALFDHHLSSFKNDSPAVAGQVQIWELPGVGDPTGPKVTNLQFDWDSISLNFGVGPSDIFDAMFPIPFEAEITWGNVTDYREWRFFVDDLSGAAFTTPVGSPTNPSTHQSFIFAGGLTNGEHVLWAQAGNDHDGNPATEVLWGPVAGLVFEMDRAGPVIRSLAANPAIVNGDALITLTGTADTTLTGPGSDVQSVKYVLDPTGPPLTANALELLVGTDLTFDGDNLMRASFTGEIATAGLSEGVHTVHIYAKDSYSQICCDPGAIFQQPDHWSQVPGEITFNIDLTAPSVDSASISPNPNDGTMAHPGSQIFLPAVKLEATLSDGEVGAPGASGIVEAEFWLDDGINPAPAEGDAETLGSATARWRDVVDGTGEACDPGDTCQYVQNVYADIPLADIRSLGVGDHTFYVRGRDAAGNWSDAVPVVLTVNAPAPTLVLTPVGNDVSFDAEATMGVIGLVEWWYTADPVPAVGLGTELYNAGDNPDPDPAQVSGSITGLAFNAISVRATDTVGGVIVVGTTVPDTVVPVVAVGAGPELAGEVTFDVTDAAPSARVTTIEWWYDSDPLTVTDASALLVPPGGSSYTGLVLSGLDPGVAITIRVTDGAGNFADTGATTGADVTAPGFANVVAGAESVTFDVNDPLPSSGIASVVWWCTSLTDTAAAAVPGVVVGGPDQIGLVLSSLTTDEITIRATDTAGNFSETTANALPPGP